MLGAMARWMWVLAMVTGCSVPTAVGDLEGNALVGASGSGSSESGQSGEVDPTTGGVDPTNTGSSSGDQASSSTGAETRPAPTMVAFAMRRGDIPPDDEDPSATTIGSGDSTDTDGGLDDDDLLVFIGFSGQTCEDPSTDTRCGIWEVKFALSVEQQVAGTYAWDEVNLGFWENGPDRGGGDCFGGGGTLESSVVVESIDGEGLQIRFEGETFGPEAVEIDGFSTPVTRC